MRSADLRAVVIGMVVVTTPLPALAFENFDQGKSPSQLFASDCSTCHQTPAGLGASMNPRALASFLTEHYTASADVAGMLASYLASNGEGQRPAATQRTRMASPADEPRKPAKSHRAAKPHNAKPSAEQERTAKPNTKPGAENAAPDVTGSTAKPAPPVGGN